MNPEIYSLTPSQAYSRIRELTSKEEFEGLSNEENDELENLKNVFSNITGDFEADF